MIEKQTNLEKSQKFPNFQLGHRKRGNEFSISTIDFVKGRSRVLSSKLNGRSLDCRLLGQQVQREQYQRGLEQKGLSHCSRSLFSSKQNLSFTIKTFVKRSSEHCVRKVVHKPWMGLNPSLRVYS